MFQFLNFAKKEKTDPMAILSRQAGYAYGAYVNAITQLNNASLNSSQRSALEIKTNFLHRESTRLDALFQEKLLKYAEDSLPNVTNLPPSSVSAYLHTEIRTIDGAYQKYSTIYQRAARDIRQKQSPSQFI